ncbi:extracellular solute-binding protein [Arcanobacterium phocae]|nr:extracellular solute-binding protein [Arcanobacterium phocae]
MKKSLKITCAVATLAMLLTACNPSVEPNDSANTSDSKTEISTDISQLPDQTLTVWDQETRGGQNEQMEAINAAFMKKYPNITIERNSQSFDNLQTTLRLALSGNDAPDVVEANNSRSMMGQFVSAGQILCLDDYAKAYGWRDRYSDDILQYSSYSKDAKTFGEGCLYGLPQVGESVGIYYSKSQLNELGLSLPDTWKDFTNQLNMIKKAGKTPLMLGNVEKWPAIHVFGAIQGAHTPYAQITTLGFGNPGASWDTSENLTAATQLQDWAKKGYFNQGFNGADYDSVWQSFANGEGVYLIAGSWLAPDLAASMGNDVGFILPPATNGEIATTGGTGLPFTITSSAKNPNVAAAYIDFLTSKEAMKILAETGNVPVYDTAILASGKQGVEADVMLAFDKLVTEGHVLPYLDYATTTMDQVIGDSLQQLVGGDITPQQFINSLQDAYSSATE